MPRYTITSKDSGEQVYEYQADAPVEWVDFPFDTFDHTAAVEPEEVPATVYAGRRRLTKLEFIDLLTDAEYATILAAARESVQIEAWIEKMKLATPEADGTSIDLDDPRTVGGVNALELIGLIGTGRAEEILRG